MMRWRLELELLDDVVFSRRAATAGDHETLDRIPGATLRGWCAAALYGELGDRAWDVFHSGKVRWLDGLVADHQGQRSVPVPLSWHANKADAMRPARGAGAWLAPHVYNLACEWQAPAEFQPKGLRSGYVGSGGQAIEPRRSSRMMTAIGNDGQVEEGQLFAYESLARGQRFVAALEVDDELQDLSATLLAALTDRSVIRLGRSRSGHYGRVKVTAHEDRPAPVLPQKACGERVHLLLISDACLRTPQGLPTLTPNAAALGLPAGAELVMERTFLRNRRVSAWNAYRGGREGERQLLSAGGVITLQMPGGFDSACMELLARGIGCERARGWGEVQVAPALLQSLHPVFDGAAHTLAAPAEAPRPESPLMRILARRTEGDLSSAAAARWVMMRRAALAQRWLQLRRYKALKGSDAWGPTPTQWGHLAAEGAASKSIDDLRQRLRPPAGTRREHWDDEVLMRDGTAVSLAQWLEESWDSLEAASDIPSEARKLDAWQQLCSGVRRLNLHASEAALEQMLNAARQEAA